MGRPSSTPEFKDILLTLLLLDHSSLGRYTLSTYLGLTKAKTRAILEYLGELGLTESQRGRGGTSLTSTGEDMVASLMPFCKLDWEQQLVEVGETVLSSDYDIAIMLLNSKDTETSGLYERDMAVRQGAKGAITLRNDQKTWKFPNDDQAAKDIAITNEVVSNYNLMIIAFGDSPGAVYSSVASIVIYHLEDELRDILT